MSGAITLTREGKSRSVGSLKIKAKSKKKKNYGVVESDSLNGADKVLTISDVHVGDRGYLILFVHSTCVQLRTGLPLISRRVVLLMGNDAAYQVMGIGKIRIKMHDDVVRSLTKFYMFQH